MSVRSIRRISIVAVLLLGASACGSTASEEDAAPASLGAAPLLPTSSVELIATQDARTQSGSPDRNFGGGILWTNTVGHVSYMEFDTTALPEDAVIERAELKAFFNGNYSGNNSVEVGRVEDAWEEGTLTWNNQPGISWEGSSATVGDAAQDIVWDVTDIVQGWQDGSTENHGFALRSSTPGGKQFWSREFPNQLPPRLVITYSLPPSPPGPLPDAGDAPDSTNHHGVVNTAYVGVPGNFPTVYQVPAGQPAGPRHDNLTLQGFLGNFITPELEADAGPDADGPNNILRNAAGVIADVANRDRGDDGWRNRNIRFYDCLQQTLVVRVSRPAGATQRRFFLNAWFDGDRSGDWAGTGVCTPPNGGPAQTSYEWIVQNFPVDMSAIPEGGFADLKVPTERVYNATEGQPHWMRFTLSEVPAATGPGGALPDGRGPHPLSAAKSYKNGETEDYFQIPPPPGELGDLVLEKRVVAAQNVVPQGGTVTYEIRLKNQGGTGPAPAFIRDQLPAPLHPLPVAGSAITVTSPGGAAPLVGSLGFALTGSGTPEFVVSWAGMLDPNSEVVLRFPVHVHPTCTPLQTRKNILNVATAGGLGAAPVSAQASFLADCPGTLTPIPVEAPVDFSSFPHFP